MSWVTVVLRNISGLPLELASVNVTEGSVVPMIFFSSAFITCGRSPVVLSAAAYCVASSRSGWAQSRLCKSSPAGGEEGEPALTSRGSSLCWAFPTWHVNSPGEVN